MEDIQRIGKFLLPKFEDYQRRAERWPYRWRLRSTAWRHGSSGPVDGDQPPPSSGPDDSGES